MNAKKDFTAEDTEDAEKKNKNINRDGTGLVMGLLILFIFV